MENLYDRIGEEGFTKLTKVFYQGVSQDPLLKPMYPEEDLGPAERRLRMFLEQYWGGPHTYSEPRGHPRLRMRHAPYRIGFLERDAWLRCMHSAVASIDAETLDDEHRRELLAYLDMAAQHMVNAPF